MVAAGLAHGRRMYDWHVTFPEAPEVQALAAAARERLAGLPGMDLVPGQWLHLTTQAIGFTDEVSDGDLAAIAGAATGDGWRASPRREVTIGPARVVSEGIVCDAQPAESLAPVRDAVRAAIGDVRGQARVPGRDRVVAARQPRLRQRGRARRAVRGRPRRVHRRRARTPCPRSSWSAWAATITCGSGTSAPPCRLAARSAVVSRGASGFQCPGSWPMPARRTGAA